MARWPYGHEWITVFVGLGDLYTRPGKLLADRRRQYVAQKQTSPESLRDEPLPHQDET